MGARTLASLLTRVLTVLPFAVNTSVTPPIWAKLAIAGFALVLAILLAGRASAGTAGLSLIGYALLSALPAASILAWIGPTAQHSRYLYWPAVWLMLFLSSIIARCRWPDPLFVSLFALYFAGASHNLWVYRDMLHRVDTSAEMVAERCRAQPSVQDVWLGQLPREPNGVFFFASEMAERIHTKLPGMVVSVSSEPSPPSSANPQERATFCWSAMDRQLTRCDPSSTPPVN
jgi:hypothetical protein